MQIGLDGAHAAADIHADCGGDDRTTGGDHRAHGSALAQMHIRHHGDVAGQDGQGGNVADLRHGIYLHGDALRPGLDIRAPVRVCGSRIGRELAVDGLVVDGMEFAHGILLVL